MPCGKDRIYRNLEVRRVQCRRCGTVKRERLEDFVENALHSKLPLHQGALPKQHYHRRGSGAEPQLAHGQAVREQYIREQLERAGKAHPNVIGIDQISVRKGHEYRIVLCDLKKHRPIWVGSTDRSEASMDEFYAFLAEKPVKRTRLAVMHMWKPFRTSTNRNAPQAAILFDRFQFLRHLGEALDKVRKQEYARLEGKSRTFIKGQKYALLSHPQNIKGSTRKTLKLLLTANKRLNTSYPLRESFGQLWKYSSEGWPRKLFANWRANLKLQGLAPFEKFAARNERHWDGIAAYCKPENKAALGFVKRLNNKIRVIQRRAYGFHDEDHLRIKILT